MCLVVEHTEQFDLNHQARRALGAKISVFAGMLILCLFDCINKAKDASV